MSADTCAGSASEVDLQSRTVPQAIDSTDYRWTHRRLLVDIFGPEHPVLPEYSAETDGAEASLGDENPDRIGHQFGGLLLPTSRSFGEDLSGLRLAAELALAHRCLLVVICSQEAKIKEFPPELAIALDQLLVLIRLEDCDPKWLPTLNSSNHMFSGLHRSNDVGSKRNIGLALAVALGWEYLLLVDDDIRAAVNGPTLNPRYLSHALSVMEADAKLKAIGWTLEDYDDNSVVGHARPLVDLPQGIFIGGGALLVRCGAELPFFPDVYNEDWLFLIALAGSVADHRSALGLGGRVHQRSYTPFLPERARSEEVGEVLGECLMNQLEDRGRGNDRALTRDYWDRALSARWQQLELIKERVRRLPNSVAGAPGGIASFDRQPLLECMTAAQGVHGELEPAQFEDFISSWQEDEETWQQHLRKREGGLGLIRDSPAVLSALRSSPF